MKAASFLFSDLLESLNSELSHLSVEDDFINNEDQLDEEVQNEEHFDGERGGLDSREQTRHVGVVEHLNEERREQVEDQLYGVAEANFLGEVEAWQQSESSDQHQRVHGKVQTESLLSY